MVLKPELLLHPNIPKPIHGLAPRVIKGEDWWNTQRQEAYKKNDYCCWACGVHKIEAKYHLWLEAHEVYEINYAFGEVRFIDVCALCHSCHNFIHSGRLHILYKKDEIPYQKIKSILKHGFEILRKAKLVMNPFALKVAREVDMSLFDNYIKYGVYDYGMCLAEWKDWFMVIDGKTYKGKFKNYSAWEKHYR